MYNILQTASENMYKRRSNNEANYHNKAMHSCHTQTMQNMQGYDLNTSQWWKIGLWSSELWHSLILYVVTNNMEETASLTTEEACSSKIPPECHNTEHYNLIELQSLVLLTAINYCALKVHILDSSLKPFSSLFLEQFDGSKLANVERSSVSSHSLSAWLTYVY